MEPLKEKVKKTRDGYKDRLTSKYRSWKLKYQSTRAYKNIDSLMKFQNIYYELLNK